MLNDTYNETESEETLRCTTLWKAVLLTVYEDYMSNDKELKEEAEKYIGFTKGKMTKDFIEVCSYADVDPHSFVNLLLGNKGVTLSSVLGDK